MREPTEEGNIAPEAVGAGKNLEKANKEVSITEAHRTILVGFSFANKHRQSFDSLSDLRIKANDGLLSPRHVPDVLPQ